LYPSHTPRRRPPDSSHLVEICPMWRPQPRQSFRSVPLLAAHIFFVGLPFGCSFFSLPSEDFTFLSFRSSPWRCPVPRIRTFFFFKLRMSIYGFSGGASRYSLFLRLASEFLPGKDNGAFDKFVNERLAASPPSTVNPLP